jgi:hypothetical protein
MLYRFPRGSRSWISFSALQASGQPPAVDPALFAVLNGVGARGRLADAAPANAGDAVIVECAALAVGAFVRAIRAPTIGPGFTIVLDAVLACGEGTFSADTDLLDAVVRAGARTVEREAGPASGATQIV